MEEKRNQVFKFDLMRFSFLNHKLPGLLLLFIKKNSLKLYLFFNNTKFMYSLNEKRP